MATRLRRVLAVVGGAALLVYLYKVKRNREIQASLKAFPYAICNDNDGNINNNNENIGNIVKRVDIEEGKNALAKTVYTLQRAFFTDPVFLHLIPDPDMRNTFLAGFFRMNVSARPFRVYSSGNETGDSVSLWMRADVEDITTLEFLINGGLKLFAFFPSLWVAIEALSFFDMLEAKHMKILKDNNANDHYYLMSLGTDPIVQGKGFGSNIMRLMTKQADKEDIPCYLESSSERSRDLYKKFGFEVIDIVRPPPYNDRSPPIFLMFREKKSKKKSSS